MDFHQTLYQETEQGSTGSNLFIFFFIRSRVKVAKVKLAEITLILIFLEQIDSISSGFHH